MKDVMLWAQVFVGILMSIAILLQNKGTGLSGIFGGEGNVYRTRRGAERGLFVLTIILAAAFLGLGAVNFLVS